MAESGPSSRYHHYVPQFILRNWAHAYRPVKGGGQKKNKSKGAGSAGKDRLFRGDKALNCISLEGPHPELVAKKVARTFGVQDLYIDKGKTGKEQHVEELLSRLEATAAEVISKISKVFENGDQEVALLRGERDVVRKFLFIMKYRGTTFSKRFLGDGPEDYVANDREPFLQYMRKRGFQKPIEVWLDNIQAFIEIEMDVERKWEEKLMERCYPADAWWFRLNTTWFYLALCTPSHGDDEFIMTENGYAIHEGPVSSMVDMDSGKVTSTAYTEHHIFAHISPKLTMVLRSALLPLAAEDVDEGMKMLRESMNRMSSSMHNDPEAAAVSFLQDLPVTKPRNSYSTYVDGHAVPFARGNIPIFSKNDKFFFKFFSLSREHVAKINCILLEEAVHTSMIVFSSKISACKALEYYLTVDSSNDSFKFKQVTQRDDDPRKLYLSKLQKAIALLGGKNIVAKYYSVAETLRDQVFELIKGNEEATNIYAKLSHKIDLDPKDFEQAQLMLKLRVKIDTWSKGLDESIREDARDHLRDLYCELPVQRLWIYVKRERFMFSGEATILTPQGAVLDLKLPPELLAGPEDLVAKLRHHFVPGKLCRIMFFAALNHRTEINPNFGLKSKDFASDEDMMIRIRQEKALVFGSQGSICDCGVPHVEKISREIRHAFQTQAFPSFGEMETFFTFVLTPEEKIELATRIETMETLLAKVKGKGKSGQSSEEEDLLGLLFDVVFPIFGRK